MMDTVDLSPLESLYLIGIVLLFLSAFLYAIYPLFNCCKDIFPEDVCFACEHGRCAMHCPSCFQCMMDLPPHEQSPAFHNNTDDASSFSPTKITSSQSSQPPPPPLEPNVWRRNSVVQAPPPEEQHHGEISASLDNSFLESV